ncbi:MAG: DUF1501 domain-containing protein [Planctomycetota bacterium]|nr:MAG: DUF1501 domain-containing protein [Planctomycetota bacterium]
MRDSHDRLRPILSRRIFLQAGMGLPALGLPASLAASPATGGKAKSVILFWLSGGASHIDTWDMKPEAPAEYRGPFKPVATTVPGIQVCEHLPLLAARMKQVAVVRSVGMRKRDLTGDHHAGYYYNQTGHSPDVTFRTLGNNRKPEPTDWPSLACLAGHALPSRGPLPATVALPEKPGAPEFTRPGQFAGRLGNYHDPFYLLADHPRPEEFSVPSLSLSGELDAGRISSRRSLAASLDSLPRQFDRMGLGLDEQSRRAYALLASAPARRAFNLHDEPRALKDRYGSTANGMALLLARRMVEAGVPFVSVYWRGDLAVSDKLKCASGGGWDTHGNNFHCLKEWLLPEFDQAYSALLDDLEARGLLDSTLVLVTSEMGRNPKVGDVRSGGVSGAGRDHWTNAMSVLLAGGGVRGGQVYGSTDKVGGYPSDKPCGPEDIAATTLTALGLQAPLVFNDRENRPTDFWPDGRVLEGML